MNNMLEKFQQLLSNLKRKQEIEPITADSKTLEGYFDMEDWNKWLKFNAFTQEQLDRINDFEKNLKKVFEILYVPDCI